ncbi:hypothetical protein [Paenibacillus sp. USDA918EY]|uniref:hypothetical protein n=1 Tax=Paenibacillus sp. USDA918EY TaxID=2689575 RepID=UPI00135AB764|nr:hypothetical protein [Paenibacillus sp. USDA918EY]
MKWKKVFIVTLVVMLFLSIHSNPMYAVRETTAASKISALSSNLAETLFESPSLSPDEQSGEDPSTKTGEQDEEPLLEDPIVDQPEGEATSPSQSQTDANNIDENEISPLAVDDITLVMYPGESYSFTNNGSKSVSISTDASSTKDNRYDYVTFNVDGSIVSTYMDHSSSFSVFSGYTAVMTATGSNPINLKLKPEISYSVSPEPALNRVLLSFGESYRFVNESSKIQDLLNDSSPTKGKLFDYVIYKENGDLRTANFEANGTPSVPKGEEIILTGAGPEPVVVAMPTQYFRGEVSDEPAFARVTINQGESYRFTNIGNTQKSISSNGSTKDKFDYVIYNPDGTESKRGSNTSTKPIVEAGKYCVLTQVTENPVIYGVPYRLFDVRPADGDAISRITVYPGESVIFHNNGSLSNPIISDISSTNGRLIDYVIYKSDNSIYSRGFNSTSKPYIPSLGYGVFTVAGMVPVIFDYTDDFSVEYSADPAFHRVTLNKGESVTFKNISDTRVFLNSDASTTYQRLFDYVTYYPDGTERSRGKATAVNPVVESGNKAVVTGVSDIPVTMGAVYTAFEVEDRPDEAISHITIYPGESAIFHNGGSRSHPIKNNASKVGGIYDYVMYRADGSKYSDSFNQSNSGPYIPAGGDAVVTVVADQPIVFDYVDDFTVQSSNEPAYLRVTLNRGESYSFTNVSSVQEGLDSNASVTKQRLFDDVVYKVDGTERNRHQATASNPILQPGEKVVVTTVSDNPVTFGAIYRSFRGGDDSGEHLIRTTISPGQSYMFTNSSSRSLNLEKMGGTNLIVDFAVYDQKGILSSDGFGSLSSPRISSGGEAIVTNVSAENVVFEHSDVVNAEISSEPAYHRITLNKGLSYQFKNIGSQNKSLESDALPANNKRFDYIVYRADGTEKNRVNDTITAPIVYVGERAIMTSASDSPVTFGAVYRLFEAIPIETPSDNQVTIRQGQSYVFKNLGTTEATIGNDASSGKNVAYDLAVYNGSNRAVEANMNGASPTVKIPPVGSAVVTVTSVEPITFQFQKPVTAELSTEPALIKKTVAAGQSAAFHNKTYYEGTILSNAVSGANNFYDFKILDAKQNILKTGEHVFGNQSVPASADIQLYNTSSASIDFGGPYRIFTLGEIEMVFIDLIDTVEQQVPERKAEAVYYRFKPFFTGTYRFAVKEKGTTDETPQMVLFNDQKMTEQLISSKDVEQNYGKEYTTMEWVLEAGRYYYLKLDEKDGKALNAAIKASKMNKQEKSVYEYGQSDQLTKITLFTGDQILFEYDKNGNLTRRTKNIFPYFK